MSTFLHSCRLLSSLLFEDLLQIVADALISVTFITQQVQVCSSPKFADSAHTTGQNVHTSGQTATLQYNMNALVQHKLTNNVRASEDSMK